MSDCILAPARASRTTPEATDSISVRNSNSSLRVTPFLALAALFTVPTFADPVDIDLPAQPLSSALRELARQTGLQVAIQSGLTSGKMTPALNGKYEPNDALTALLRGTGLTAYPVSTNTYGIREVHANTSKNDSFHSTSWQTGPSTVGLASSDSRGAERQDLRTAESENQSSLEEVIVTAQKREERLIDVPISIVALGGAELEKRLIRSLDDLPAAVPGLAISPAGSSGRAIQLRGISNLFGNSSLIGMYLDEADATLGSTAGGGVQLNPSTYDLERVEVLRGPQGTLYGEGSAGGTIRFITRKPDLTRFSFGADVSASFTQNGEPSERISTVVNIPVIEQQLGLRLVGTFDREGGWIDQPAADRKDINPQNVTNVRVMGLWKPLPAFTATAMAVINRTERSTDVSDPNDALTFTQVFNLTATPRIKNDSNLYNLTMTYDAESVRLLSSSTYIWDANPIWNQSQVYQEKLTDLDGYYSPVQEVNDHLFAQELRLSSLGTNPWQWTVGGFYRHYDDSFNNPVNYFGPVGPGTTLPAQSYANAADTLHKSWSAFADTSYKFLQRLTIGAGVRYFRENQQATDYSVPITETGVFHSVDPRAYLQYAPADNFNLYTSAARGFRSGGFNPFGGPSYDPESVWTYELGAKMAMWDGRLRLDTDVFWSTYDDFQTVGITPGSPISVVANVGKARIKGVEWGVTLVPAAHWSLSFNGDYLDTRFTDINSEKRPDGSSAAPYAPGDPIDLVPKYQLSLSAERDVNWGTKPGSVRLGYSRQGRETSISRNIGPWFSYRSDIIDLLDFRATLVWSENLRLGLFAQNLLNEQGFANPYAQILAGVRPRPRSYGVEFGVTF